MLSDGTTCGEGDLPTWPRRRLSQLESCGRMTQAGDNVETSWVIWMLWHHGAWDSRGSP